MAQKIIRLKNNIIVHWNLNIRHISAGTRLYNQKDDDQDPVKTMEQQSSSETGHNEVNMEVAKSSEVNKEDDSKSGGVNSEAAQKLKDMLLNMKKVDFKTPETTVQIPKPRQFHIEQSKEEAKARELKAKEDEANDLGNRLTNAASEVAKLYKDDEKKTEMELLELLLAKKTDKPVLDHMEVNQADQMVDDQQFQKIVPSEPSKTVNLGDLISGMKIDTTSPDATIPLDQTRAHQIKTILARRTVKRDGSGETVMSRRQQDFRRDYPEFQKESTDIYGESPLGIFDVKKFETEPTQTNNLDIWDAMALRELRICITHPPTNIYELMIQWTEQGKLWRFPIDNEQDTPEEQQVDFTEHVFLEKHLYPWCPTSGPIRHFMELVCVGLSKNPYLTVEEKKWHILWFEDYFRAKNDLLREAGIEQIADKVENEKQAAEI